MNLPQEAINPKGPIASRGGSIPVFLRKLLQLFMIFQRGGGVQTLSSLWIDPCIYPGCMQKGKLLTFLPHNEANQKVFCYLS